VFHAIENLRYSLLWDIQPSTVQILVRCAKIEFYFMQLVSAAVSLVRKAFKENTPEPGKKIFCPSAGTGT
jgi:hypothetical protein